MGRLQSDSTRLKIIPLKKMARLIQVMRMDPESVQALAWFFTRSVSVIQRWGGPYASSQRNLNDLVNSYIATLKGEGTEVPQEEYTDEILPLLFYVTQGWALLWDGANKLLLTNASYKQLWAVSCDMWKLWIEFEPREFRRVYDEMLAFATELELSSVYNRLIYYQDWMDEYKMRPAEESIEI